MSLFSPLLVISFDQEQLIVAQRLVAELGFSDAHVVSDGFEGAIKALSLRRSSPESILIWIGERTNEVLPDLDRFAHYCDANVRVIIIGKTNDIQFYRELKQRGVLEYFAEPVNPQDLLSILVSPKSAQPLAASDVQQGAVIGCMSAASGDGASTLALNLSYALATQYRQSVVLVDLDYQFGLVAKSLDLNAPFGIREAFEYPDRGLDELLVSKMLVSYKDHFSIIAAPGELRILPAIRPEIVRSLLAILRRKFRFVVLDIPHVWTDWTAAAISYSDHRVMVAQLWLRSLTHATRLLSAWQSIGVGSNDISLLINRSGAKFKEALSPQDFERISRQPIALSLHNDVKAISSAEHNAMTLFEQDQNTPLKQQISGFAQTLVQRYAPEAMDQKNTARKTIFQFAKILKGGDVR